MGQTINIFFGGSWIGLIFAIGLLVLFYKWTNSKLVVGVVAVFLIVTRFTWITVEPPSSAGDGQISVVGETGNE